MDQKTINQLFEEISEIKLTMATKNDLVAMKKDLIQEIKESEAFIVGSVDKNKADKHDVEELDKRVTKIERKLAS